MLYKVIIIPLVLLILLGGCGNYEGGYKLPGVYRIDIQQGNIIDQEMLDKLKPGMDKNQVRFIMGTPVLIDPFHTERWEYIYTFSKSGRKREQRHISLYFVDEKLAYLEGDVITGIRKPPDEIKQRTSVDVPARRKQKGFFSKMFDAIPFIGDDESKAKKPADTDTNSEQGTEDADQSDKEEKENTEIPGI